MKRHNKATNGRIPSRTGKPSTGRDNPRVRDVSGQEWDIPDSSSWGEIPSTNWDLPEWRVEEFPVEDWPVEALRWDDIELDDWGPIPATEWDDLPTGDWDLADLQ